MPDTSRHHRQSLVIHLSIDGDTFDLEGASIDVVEKLFQAWTTARLGHRGLAEGLNASTAKLKAAILKAGK